MIRKPWPIIFTSVIFFLTPFFNITYTYFIADREYPFSDYLYSLIYLPTNNLHAFDMIVPSLIAGYAIYAVKKWSYPVFLACMAWLALRFFYSFDAHPTISVVLLVIVIPMTVNILFVSYILLPAVRAAYYDPKLRWWETKPRYLYPTKIEVHYGAHISQGKMINVSEGGLLASFTTAIPPETIVNLEFKIFDSSLNLKAKVVYQKGDGPHGVQFIELTKDQRKLIKRTIALLKESKCQELRATVDWKEDLANWFWTFIKTGKGLVPEVPLRSSVIKKKEDS